MAAAAATTCGYFKLGRSSIVAPIPSRKKIGAAGPWKSRGLSLKASAVVDDRLELNENSEGVISGEWTDNFSLLCYDDLRAYFQPQSSKGQETSGPVEVDEVDAEGIISGEWPENFSLLCYDDIRAYFMPQILERQARRKSLLREVMSLRRAAMVDQTLEEIDHHFEVVSALPVIDDEFRCVGFVTKEDKDRATHGLKSKVGEVVSCPRAALSADKTVLDAAAVMLKMHIYNIAILDEQRLVGIVNDNDILHELEVVAA